MKGGSTKRNITDDQGRVSSRKRIKKGEKEVKAKNGRKKR